MAQQIKLTTSFSSRLLYLAGGKPFRYGAVIVLVSTLATGGAFAAPTVAAEVKQFFNLYTDEELRAAERVAADRAAAQTDLRTRLADAEHRISEVQKSKPTAKTVIDQVKLLETAMKQARAELERQNATTEDLSGAEEVLMKRSTALDDAVGAEMKRVAEEQKKSEDAANKARAAEEARKAEEAAAAQRAEEEAARQQATQEAPPAESDGGGASGGGGQEAAPVQPPAPPPPPTQQASSSLPLSCPTPTAVTFTASGGGAVTISAGGASNSGSGSASVTVTVSGSVVATATGDGSVSISSTMC